MDKEAIREELKKVQDDIRALKKDFLKKKDEKEKHFTEGEKVSDEINVLYEEVKKIEEENNLDKINEELDEKKKLQEELIKSVQLAQNNFDKVKTQEKLTPKAPKIRTVSVDKAKKELDNLELKLQTQVLNLDKESEITKKIAELRGTIESHSGGGDTSNSSNDFNKAKKELNSIRKKLSNCERKIRSLYKQIRLISKEKKKRYKQIDELRGSRKKEFENFRTEKKVYGDLGKNLKDLYKKEEEFLDKLGESSNQKKRNVEKNLKAKQKEVETKLQKGATLTTEDLLAFQSK